VRVGIFDPDGKPAVFTEREFALEHPRPGWAEQNPEEWWSALVAAVRAATEEGAVEQTLAKYIGADGLARRLELLREVWPGLRERVREQLMPADQKKEMLKDAGCPTGPDGIGLRWEDLGATYARARTIRKRYTVLDLAFECGILDECVDELFAPERFWSRVAG
jgi:FGGY family of carbohydrate kinases, N-terminal domain